MAQTMVRQMPRSAKPAEFDDEFNPLRDGIASLSGVIARNPVVVGGSTAFLVAFFYVSANAVWYQPHFHKGAFFATRDVVDLETLPSEDAVETTIRIERPSESVPSPSDPVVERVQSVLRDLDFYSGDVDGLMGPNTHKAIEAYRGKVGLPASGEIDDELLDHLGARQTTSAVTPRPAPAPRDIVVAPLPRAAPATVETVSIDQPAVAKDADPRVMRVQAGLKAFGHDTMEIDGLMGAKTRTAIKEFQAIFGLPVTGEPDDALFAKMREAGLTN